jgi:Tfp pilus assembly protein PilO
MANKTSKGQKSSKGPDIFTKVAKLKRGAKLGALFGGMALVVAAFYLMYYSPWRQTMTQLQSEVDGLNAQVKAEKTSVSQHKPIADYVRPVSDTYAFLSGFLTNENEIPRLIQTIADLGTQSGARVTLFAPKQVVPRANYAEIEFSMNLEGTFLSVLKLFYSLSQMDRLINIRTVTMDTPKMTDNSVMILSVKCEGSAYRSLTPDEASAADEAEKTKKK